MYNTQDIHMPLVLDGTTGFSLPAGAEIGIGTTTPAGNGLHVDHTAGATLRLTRLGTSTSHFVQLETDGAHGTLRSEGNLTLQSGGANPRITVLSTGFVGIGNQATNPIRPLHVNHNGATGGIVATFQSNGNPWVQQAGASSSFQFGATSNGWELFNDNNSAYLLAVKTDGNVGIGTRNPGVKLHIDGGGSSPELRVAQNSTYYTDIGINHIDVAGNDLRILMGGAEKWRFKNAGNLEATGIEELRTGIKGTHGYEAYYGANGLRFNRDGDSYIDTRGTNNNLKFRHNSSYDTAMTILGSNGNVGIGTTGPVSNSSCKRQ